MKADEWQRITDLFHAALERGPDERAAFLAQACAGDESLRREVESLIASHEPSDDFMESLAPDLAAGLLAENQARLVVGQSIGHYKVMALLGAGGMGEVYLTEDTRLGRRVALKLLPAQFTKEPDRLRRFEREARAASALNHPNIITIHEVGQAGGAPFIITEFIEGQTLRQQMAAAKMRLQEVLDVAIQVASALEAAHKAGIVHRDIKPENIMLRPDGLVKVLDFGLAKLTEKHSPTADRKATTLARVQTKTGLVMGTVTYMSPEQARGLAVDARSDTFSLGVVLYEMIAGRVPFDGATTSDVIVSILEKEPSPLSRYEPEVPTEVERIVKKGLDKNRDERYQTAKDLVIDLKNVKEELEIRAKLNAVGVAGETRRSVDTDAKSATRTDVAGTAHTTSGVGYLWANRGAGWKMGAAALALLAVAAAIAFLLTQSKPAQPTSDSGMNRIAVLPFKPLSAESRDEALELGMADTLINKLSSIKQLVVWPLSEVRKYTSLEQNSIAAGRELGVDYVLEGHIQMAGEKTRVTWSVLNVKDGSALWTDKCDEQCSDVFELQDTIAEQIAAALALKLTDEEKKQVTKHYTDSPEAYQLYALGMSETNRQKKLEYFERAIKIDPNYALAYLGIFVGYFGPETRGFYVSKEERLKLEWAAMKAAQLDDTLALAHVALAHIRKYYWDWAAADKEFKRALELDPNYYQANYLYGAFLVDVGRLDDALVYGKRADQVNPQDPGQLSIHEAYAYYHMRQYDKAIELSARGRKPTEPFGLHLLAEAYLAKGMYELAVAEMEKVVTIIKEPQRRDGYPILAYAYAKAGRRDEAMKILAEQHRLAKQGYISPYNFAVIYTGLGDKDRAFEYLEKAYKEHAMPLVHFPSRPMFDSLHSDARYADLVRRMNLPQFAN